MAPFERLRRIIKIPQYFQKRKIINFHVDRGEKEKWILMTCHSPKSSFRKMLNMRPYFSEMRGSDNVSSYF